MAKIFLASHVPIFLILNQANRSRPYPTRQLRASSMETLPIETSVLRTATLSWEIHRISGKRKSVRKTKPGIMPSFVKNGAVEVIWQK